MVAGPVADKVRELGRRGSGGDIAIHGSITLGKSLLAAGLVDELESGRRSGSTRRAGGCSEGVEDLRRLELVRATPTPGGSVWLTYRVP